MPRIPAEQRRGDFIKAAIAVIARHGVDGATTRRIAHEAGAPLASLHYCFSSKEELFAAIYDDTIATALDSVIVVRQGAGLGRTAATMMRQLARWSVEELSGRIAELELFLWMSRTDLAAARRTYGMYPAVVEAKLREGMRRDDDVSLVEPLARLLIIWIDGMTPWLQAYGDQVDVRESTIDVIAESMERLAEAHRG